MALFFIDTDGLLHSSCFLLIATKSLLLVILQLARIGAWKWGVTGALLVSILELVAY